MESNITFVRGPVPFGPSEGDRAAVVDRFLADLRERLMAADRFTISANQPVVRQGWEKTPCGGHHPRYAVSNTASFHVEVTTGPPVPEYPS